MTSSLRNMFFWIFLKLSVNKIPHNYIRDVEV